MAFLDRAQLVKIFLKMTSSQMILMNSGLVSNSAVYTLNGGTMCCFRLGRQ